MQEARLALWSRLREALDLTDAERYYHNVHRALYNHVRRMAPVHCSEKRFASAIRTVHIAPLESLDAGQSAPPFELHGWTQTAFWNRWNLRSALFLA